MYITPDFTVSQDNAYLTIVIKAPHVKAQEVDFFIEGTTFKFYIKPYFLRLNLPGNVVEDDRARASYDIAEGKVTVLLPKETPGEHFPDLDLLTKLLAPRRKGPSPDEIQRVPGKRPLIEIVEGNGGDSKEKRLLGGETEPGVDFDWELPQEIPEEEINPTGTATYGFNNHYSGVFSHCRETGNEVMELADPEHSTLASRREERIRRENEKFDEDYYIGELMNDDGIQDHLNYTPPWIDARDGPSETSESRTDDCVSTQMSELNIVEKDPAENQKWILNDTDRQEMRRLANKEFLIDDPRTVYLGLVDLLFAYCYDHRVTEGEGNIESAWSICKLSPSIAALDTPTSLRGLLVTLYRRSLAYPLYRNWKLCELVHNDLRHLLRCGKRACLKALLEMKRTLDASDVYYVYSTIWVQDYCVWIMGASDKTLRALARKVKHIDISKAETNWNLEELEKDAQDAQDEDSDDDDEESSSEEDEDTDDDDDDDATEDDTNASGEDKKWEEMQKGTKLALEPTIPRTLITVLDSIGDSECHSNQGLEFIQEPGKEQEEDNMMERLGLDLQASKAVSEEGEEDERNRPRGKPLIVEM